MSLSKLEMLEKLEKRGKSEQSEKKWEKLDVPSMKPAAGYDGQIDEQLIGVHLDALVLGGQGYEAEDHLQVRWNGTTVFRQDIKSAEVEAGVEVKIEKRYVVAGDATVGYIIISHVDGEITDSHELHLKVNPAIPDA
ncbi:MULTISPECIES: hypothetical protein [unclassified Pseudomonas]|uniref:hypothetical protein n=1 Tax=unclassified Pseudomonas TaxID=196821 RepID=UPI000CD0A3A8|nr:MULTISPECIES: hypothetical protein [unclassified Pseudomonas]POA34339.1 hypothetical protein C1887_03800 [Pseudomonas sp. GW456-R21]POA66448.1 hypothetical protein C1884_14850 [Pseudomonas sp. GW460-R15]